MRRVAVLLVGVVALAGCQASEMDAEPAVTGQADYLVSVVR